MKHPQQHPKQGGQCNHSFELGNVAGLPEEVLFICPKCGTLQEGEITSKSQQQESWRRELSRIYTKHEHYFQDVNNEGFAQYDYDKIFADFESLISTQRQRVLDEVKELVGRLGTYRTARNIETLSKHDLFQALKEIEE